jgi:thermitase
VSRGNVPSARRATRQPYFLPTDYPDHRRGDALDEDRGKVQRQLALLDADNHESLDHIIELIRSRQEEAPAEHALRFDQYHRADGSHVLVARAEIVVRVRPRRAPAAAGGAAHLDPAALDPASAVAALGYDRFANAADGADPHDPDIEVFVHPDPQRDLGADVRALRARGVEAGVHLVVPLGHIVKGDDYPSPTTMDNKDRQVREFAADPQATVRVALIDTGITDERRTDGFLAGIPRDADHIDRYDVLPAGGDGRVDWCGGHGTFGAGIVQQVAPGCEIVVYRFTRSDGLGTEKEVAEALLRAARDARDDGVRLVINASLGTPAVDGQPPLAMRNAVERINAEFPDVLIVASAGNLGTTEKMYPAAFDRVVAVGALNDDLTPAGFSNHGGWLDCSAVGSGVTSTFVEGVEPPERLAGHPDVSFPANSWGVWSGTSFSAPQIAGAVARRCLEDATLSPQQAIDELCDGQPVLDGYGRVFRLLPGTPV